MEIHGQFKCWSSKKTTQGIEGRVAEMDAGESAAKALRRIPRLSATLRISEVEPNAM